MDPIITGALISAGSKLAGNLLSGTTNDKRAIKREINTKMAMASKHGISKLAMLGAPISAGGSHSVGGGLGETIADMGADVGRAFAARQTDEERLLQSLTLKKAGLENAYLEAQINSINNRTRRESAPPVPVVNGLQPEEIKPGQRTPGLNAGVGYPTNPYFMDSETFTSRYGESEIFEMIMGLVNGTADAYWNMPNSSAGVPSIAARRAAILKSGTRY